MKAKRPNNSTPPNVSAREFSFFLSTLRNGIPKRIDKDLLIGLGIGTGTAGTMLPALRWLNLIDRDGIPVTEKRMLERLADPKQRASACRELLETTEIYRELSKTNLQNATIETIAAEFGKKGLDKGTLNKYARFYLWMAQEAGYELGEYVVVLPDSRIPPQAVNIRSEFQPDTVNSNAETETAENYPDDTFAEMLRSFSDNLEVQREAPQITLLKHVRELFDEEVEESEVSASMFSETERFIQIVQDLAFKSPKTATAEVMEEIVKLRLSVKRGRKLRSM